LIVVAPGVSDKDRPALVRHVIEAVGGSPPAGLDQGEFKHPAFARAFLYRPVTGWVDRGRVAGRVAEVAEEMDRLLAGGKERWVNDLILVYYQGEDFVGPGGRP